MKEIWKKINWIDGLKSDYMVSSLGRIKRTGGFHHTFQGEKYIVKEFMLSPNLTSHGYLSITLYPFGKEKHFYVHRIVADAFIEKEDGKNFINHINEIKTDNRVENLERCTNEYNIKYSHYKLHVPAKIFRRNEHGRNIKKSKKDGKYEVQCYHNGKGKHIGRYKTVKEARKARNDYLESLGLLEYLTEEERLCEM